MHNKRGNDTVNCTCVSNTFITKPLRNELAQIRPCSGSCHASRFRPSSTRLCETKSISISFQHHANKNNQAQDIGYEDTEISQSRILQLHVLFLLWVLFAIEPHFKHDRSLQL